MTKTNRGCLALSAAFGLGLVLALTAPAAAQTPPPPPPPATSTYGGTIGVGASAFLSGLAGVQVDYDQYVWDIEGILGFGDRSVGGGRDLTVTTLGVRGWYHLHHGVSSDFSIGGGVGVAHDSGGGNPSSTVTLIEPGARARAFITPNVAVHAIVGVSVSVGDDGVNGTTKNTGVGLDAQLLANFGFTYFFR